MINQIPFTLNLRHKEDLEEIGTEIRKYFAVSLTDEIDQKMFWQYMGYCMTTDTRFQKFLMIKGKGGTGKSVAVSLIQYITGTENSSSISLQDLNKRFYATGLFGKILNACADIPCTALQNVDIIKKAVGEDTLLYEKKGQDPTQFCSYAKLLFSANEMPLNLDDKSNAYYRRLLVLDMNATISEKAKDTGLKDKILKESEYVINMALLNLKELYKNGKFIESEHSKKCIEELHRSADSVKAYLDEKIERKQGITMKRSDMYQYYKEYCEENGRQEHGKSVFFRMLGEKGYSPKRNSDGYYYDNISLKDDGFMELGEEMQIPFLA